MTDIPAATAIPPFHERLATFTRRLPQRFGERDFWITQAGVLGVTAVHVLAELWVFQGDRDVPSVFHHIPVVLYLAPIGYASLRYGQEGAVLTGLWSAALTLPNLLVWHQADFEWLEVLYVAVVVAVGIVMSVPVERERRQRQRAEATIRRQVLLNDIALLTLTADLPTTLDVALRRLLDVLDLEATCIAVADPPRVTEGTLSVLACQPSTASWKDALTACLHSRRPLDDPAGAASARDDIVVVPLTADLPGSGPEGRVDGVLVVKLGPACRLTEDDLGLLAGVASHVAVAIANERLTESERNRLRSYAMLVTQAQEEERTRIARELHDEASQNLIVIRRGLAALTASLGDHPAVPELGGLQALVGQSVAGMREFGRDLRPPTLDELGVSSALDQLVTQVRERSGLAAQLRVDGPYRRLPTETELAVFRIGQAALHNVERHAAAAIVDVELTFGHEWVRLTVTDDGCGFQPPQNLDELPETGKLGLIGMRERAQLVGGTLQIRSRPRTGTRIDLEVPG